MSGTLNIDAGSFNNGQHNEQVNVQISAIERTLGEVSVLEVSERLSTGKAGTEVKGHLFESKLLTLFMVRAISADYQFELTSNNEDIGGKFDDIVFRYEVLDNTHIQWRYRYVQAKHKVDRTALSIQSSHLLHLSTSTKDDVTDYSLLKYFKSYCKIKARGDDIQDCIICTTIDFDYKNMDGITLRRRDMGEEKILRFEVNDEAGDEKRPVLYNLKLLESSMAKLFEADDIRILAKQLKICATESHSPTLKQDIFNKYHVALVEEKILHLNPLTPKGMKFHKDFVDNAEALSNGAKGLRQMLIDMGHEKQDLAKWKFQRPGNFGKPTEDNPIISLPQRITDDDVEDFCNKLVFVVNAPSEDELDSIIRVDLGKYYNQDDVKNQFLRVSNQVLDWFKSVEKPEWLSSETGKTILLDETTKKSVVYRDEIEKGLGFNQNAVAKLAKELDNLIKSSEIGKVIRVSSQWPKWTAAKVISAIETWPAYKTSRHDSYWVTSTNCLLNKDEKEMWINRLKVVKNSRHLLVVVDEEQTASLNDRNITDLIPNNPTRKNKVIVISTDQEGHIKDKINFGDLNEESRTPILSTTISFQGSDVIVRDLIGSNENVIDYFSIKELMGDNKKQISIPSFNMSDFEKSLYIERQMLCPFQQQLMSELIKSIEGPIRKWKHECTVDQKGKITWSITDKKQKSEIWEKMKVILGKNDKSSDNSPRLISENELLNERDIRVIITGVAGTGKSSVLSYYYEILKSKKPDCWVIKISLMRYSQTLLKFDVMDQKSAIEFIVNFPAIGADQSSFAKSLLRNRLEIGDRTVIMFDGFDEIQSECQDKVIKLINNLNKNISIFVTTRPHMADKLQFELSQLAYKLVKFDKKDQIKYITSVWEKELTNETATIKEKEISEFATMLIDRVSKTLNDEEKNFLGIPLQCRILAECFQSKVKAIFQEGTLIPSQSFSSLLEDRQNFDLASLYKLLIDTKRKEKFKFQTDNYLANYFAEITNKQLECHLTKLAIRTIVQNKEDADVLWPEDPRYQSEKDWEENENNLDKLGVDLGLLLEQNKESRSQFLHRTYAEYLVADYVYKGFHLDENSHNKLLENNESRHCVVRSFLATNKYDGVQVFLASMFKEWMAVYANEKLQKSTRDFPKHLQEFSSFFIENKCSLLWLIARNDSGNRMERKENTVILKFVLNCLEATFARSAIRAVITRDVFQRNIADIILQMENDLFQRILKYYDDANFKEWKTIFLNFCNVNEHFQQRIVCWDQEVIQENIKFFLNFIENHYKRLKRLLNDFDKESQKEISNMIKFLIQNSNFDKTEQFYRILSSTCSIDTFIVLTLFKDAISQYYNWNWKKGKILEMLNFLRHTILGNKEVQILLYEISCLVLRREPETFQQFYQQIRQSPEAEFNANSDDSVTATDLFGMTLLHRAVLHGDIQFVKHVLYNYPETFALSNVTKSLENLSLQDESTVEKEGSELIIKLMINTEVSENADLTPMYVAFACCNEEMCDMMLQFLKRSLSTIELRDMCTKENGCLTCWTKDAMRYRKEKMFQTILKAVKNSLDFEVLVDLLKPSEPGPGEDFEYYGPGMFMGSPKNCWLVKNITDVIVEDDETCGYEKLNRFIFCDVRFLEWGLQYGETITIQKLIKTQGFERWIKDLLNKFDSAFWFLSAKNFLIGLDENQRTELVDIVTTSSKPGTSTSYWIECINNNISYATNFMKCISEIFHENENVVKKLLFHEDDSGVCLIRNMLYTDKANVNQILSHLTQQTQQEFHRHWAKHAIKHIDNKLERLEKIEPYNRLKFLQFYLDNGSEDQLSNFITISRSFFEDGESHWSFSTDEMQTFMQRMSDKLGENTVKDLIFQDNGSVIRPLFIDHLPQFEELYLHLSNEKRDDIRHHVFTMPGVISYLLMRNWEYWTWTTIARNVLDGFNMLATYFLKEFTAQQLQDFIEFITIVKDDTNVTANYSIWEEYIDQACKSDYNHLIIINKSIKTFMECVARNLDTSFLEKLTFDDVTNHVVSSGKILTFETLISQFDERKQREIRQRFLCRLTIVHNVWNFNGPENLIRFYLLNDTQEELKTMTIVTGFNILTTHFLSELNQDHLNRWIQLIMSVIMFNTPNNCSVWSNYIEELFLNTDFKPTEYDLNMFKKLLHRIDKLLGKETVSQLLRHQDVNGVIISQITDSENGRSTGMFDEILEYLSVEDRLGNLNLS